MERPRTQGVSAKVEGVESLAVSILQTLVESFRHVRPRTVENVVSVSAIPPLVSDGDIWFAVASLLTLRGQAPTSAIAELLSARGSARPQTKVRLPSAYIALAQKRWQPDHAKKTEVRAGSSHRSRTSTA